jgi:hypothetical protein
MISPLTTAATRDTEEAEAGQAAPAMKTAANAQSGKKVRKANSCWENDKLWKNIFLSRKLQ